MSEKSSLNIEFSHIYINESFNSEHKKSAEIMKKILESNPTKKITTTVLVDDYNPTESFFVEQEFLNNLEKIGAKPDYLAFESKLVLWTEEILNHMTGKLRKKYLHYVVSKGKTPCSLLVAIWYLLRLGALDYKYSSLTKPIITNSSKKPFISENIMTILPHRYKAVEDNSREIIKSTHYADYLSKMETRFF